MNKPGDDNRSVRNTKRRLKDGLIRLLKEKPINEITAKELTEQVDVNRGTFYFHYSDIYALLRSVEDDFFEEFDRILSDMPEGENRAMTYLTAIFTFMGQNAELCQIMLGQNGDMLFVERVKGLVEEHCSAIWRSVAPQADDARIELFNAFLINGCIGAIKRWIDGGMAESPELISRMVTAIIMGAIGSYIG